MLSTMKSVGILSIKVRTVSDFKLERYSVVTGVRDILYRHLMLCDILELINSFYSLQVLALIGSKFVYASIFLYLFIYFFFDIRSFLISISFLRYTHTAWHFRRNATCYSGVMLQVCLFSGGCYLKTLH